MEADATTRDLDNSELDAAIESISALSRSITPPTFDIDLSVLANPPHGTMKRRTASQDSQKRRLRKPSRAPSESSIPLPSSPPIETLDTSNIDGPEDFTINMEYWMRCSLDDLQKLNKDGADDEEETKRGSMESPPEPTLHGAVDDWVTRGNDRLKALAAERFVESHDESTPTPDIHRPITPSMEEETQGQDAVIDHVREASDKLELEASKVETGYTGKNHAPIRLDLASEHASLQQPKPPYQPLANDGGSRKPPPRQESPISMHQTSESDEVNSTITFEGLATRPAPPRPTVEDYISTPIRPDPFVPLKEKAAQEYREGKARSPQESDNFFQKAAEHETLVSSAQSRPVKVDRLSSLEAEVRALRAELTLSRREAQQAQHIDEQSRFRETLETQMQALTLRPEEQGIVSVRAIGSNAVSLRSTSPFSQSPDEDRAKDPPHDYAGEMKRPGVNPSAQLAAKQVQMNKIYLLDPDYHDAIKSANEQAGALSPCQQYSQEREECSTLEDKTQVAPILPTHDRQSDSSDNTGSSSLDMSPNLAGATSSPGDIAPFAKLRASNDPYVNRKLAQLLGMPNLPPASHLDRLIAVREEKVSSLQAKLDAVTKQKNDLAIRLREEKSRMETEAKDHREALATQRAEDEARVSFLRDEVTQKSAELADARLHAISAQRDAEDANGRLRSREDALANEVMDLKAKLAASNAMCQEQRVKIDRMSLERTEMQTHVRSMEERDRDLDHQLPNVKQHAVTQVDEPLTKTEETVATVSRALDKERTSNASLQREVSELKDELDLLREQLRVSTLDGAFETEEGRRDSGIAVEDSFMEQSTMSMKGEMQNLRNELREQIKSATDARAETKALRVEHEKLQREIVRLGKEKRRVAKDYKDLLEERAQVELEYEKALQQELALRDQETKRRYKELQGESKQRGRALLRAWGEMECGEGAPQKYHYAS